MNFFTEKEDLRGIIKSLLPRVDDIKHIKTGWTNIVFEVESGEESFFFRFPRNDFFSKMIAKDCAFCTFINGRTSFETPKLELHYHVGRPFSVHRKIIGHSLTERISHISRREMENAAYDISNFILQLNSIPTEEIPGSCNMKLSDFLDELSTVDDDFYDLEQHDGLRGYEANLSTVHGDLNPGNILLDENDRVVAVLDFAFGGRSHKNVDISRVVGRSPPELREIYLGAYDDVTGETIDRKQVDDLLDLWNYVEREYIAYIRNNLPEIVLPA